MTEMPTLGEASRREGPGPRLGWSTAVHPPLASLRPPGYDDLLSPGGVPRRASNLAAPDPDFGVVRPHESRILPLAPEPERGGAGLVAFGVILLAVGVILLAGAL